MKDGATENVTVTGAAADAAPNPGAPDAEVVSDESAAAAAAPVAPAAPPAAPHLPTVWIVSRAPAMVKHGEVRAMAVVAATEHEALCAARIACGPEGHGEWSQARQAGAHRVEASELSRVLMREFA